jgi:hypothetical protein
MSEQASLDFQIHQVLTVRTVDAPPGAIERLQREIGPLRASEGASPDLTIRFVDRVPAVGETRYLDLDTAAYDDAGFYLLDARGRRTLIPFERFGEPCEIVCEKGIEHVPLVREALALRLLAKGSVLLHSAAFSFEGRTVLVAGWQKGGKSELLLSFMAVGATFISDEWTIVEPESQMLAGLGDRLYVWDWHLAQLPSFRRRLRSRERAKLRLLAAYRTVYRLLGSPVADAFPWSLAGRLARVGAVSALGQVQPTPERLFGRLRADVGRLETLILAAVATGDVRVGEIDPLEVADRMVASQTYERRRLAAAYAGFRYAFPARRNPLLESAAEHDLALLRRAFRDVPAYELLHPYPVRLAKIQRAVAPLLRGRS